MFSFKNNPFILITTIQINLKKITYFFFIILIFNTIKAQAPDGYYNGAIGKSGYQLQAALAQIIDNHIIIDYDDLWDYYAITDVKPNDSIWDIYSNCNFSVTQHGSLQQGQSGECYVYNREHSFCQSWCDADGSHGAPYSDMFHIYPVDSWINSIRNDNPFGEVQNANRTFLNGSKMGTNTFDGAPAVTAYEPINEYKGDIARSFFYMATRYLFENQSFSSDKPMTLLSQLKPWALEMLKNWHTLDPVSQKEIDRNNAIYGIQQNRNPFIDHPQLVGLIWGNDSLNSTFSTDYVEIIRPRVTDFEVNNTTSITIAFDSAMNIATIANVNNYGINQGIIIDSITVDSPYQVTLSLDNPIILGLSYYCVIHNLQAESGYFIADTAIVFDYGYSDYHTVISGWTFDSISTSEMYDSKMIPCLFGMFQNESELYFGGQYGADIISDSEIENFPGTAIGDPRTIAYAGESFSIQNYSANGKSFVLKFPTRYFLDILLTYACRITGTGFNRFFYEWSLDGQNYTPVSDVAVNMDELVQYGNFALQTIDIQLIDEIEQQDMVYFRIRVDGASSAQGNVRFDNISVHGRKCVENYVIYDTVPRGTAYNENGFNIPINETQQLGTFQFDRQINLPNSCDSMITLILTVQSTVGMQNIPSIYINMYPNPADETVTVEGGNIAQIRVINCIGQTVCHYQVQGMNHFTFPVHSLETGIYFVEIKTICDEKLVKKLIIKH
jgi:endonuclease I